MITLEVALLCIGVSSLIVWVTTALLFCHLLLTRAEQCCFVRVSARDPSEDFVDRFAESLDDRYANN